MKLFDIGWITVKAEDGKGIIEIDKNMDGEPSIKIEIDLIEGWEEIKN